MNKRTAVVVMILALVGCAAGLPSQEFTAEAIETVEANNTVVNEAGLSLMELGVIVLLAGWAIPSPSEMFKGLFSFINLFRGK